ncbi:MAG: hypothetical protein OXI81_17300 [Paracoccaceae bacterium]|nr:hypothetical protein [Paracoccaceae bacterium]MDE2912429.1 hypothetical protein [Paracoccaceae bacterium]
MRKTSFAFMAGAAEIRAKPYVMIARRQDRTSHKNNADLTLFAVPVAFARAT